MPHPLVNQVNKDLRDLCADIVLGPHGMDSRDLMPREEYEQFWQLTNDQKGWIYSSDEFRNQKETAADFWNSASEDYKFWILAGGLRCIQQDSEGKICGRFHAPTTCPNFQEVSL